MRMVNRAHVLSLSEYEKARPAMRQKMMQIKQDRRIHVGQHLTFLFENFETILYQIQEMIRTEDMTDDHQIDHEIETYNELVGAQGELGCTLLIEIESPEERARLLSRWLDLPQQLYIKTNDGQLVRAEFDERQMGSDRISSVHYLRFKLGDKRPVAVGCLHPDLQVETPLTREQTVALCSDLMATATPR